jgi:hypothetical protein
MTKCFISVDGKPSISIELFDHSVANKFLDELKWHLDNSSVDNNEAFYNYADEATVQSDLLDAITKINTFLKTDFIKIPNQIDWNNHDIYNYFHLCFEQLNGKWDQPTTLLLIAPQEIKKAIRMINFAVHRLERRPYNIEREFYLSWNKDAYRRQQLTDDEHKYFTNIIKPGVVYLNYVEVGKNLFDLYQDDLDPTYGGYENLHYVGAEIRVNFNSVENDMFTPGFREWAKQHNIDLSDKQLGIGKLPIGTFTGSDQLFTKDSKITNIQIEE